jgi:hypothetical protein
MEKEHQVDTTLAFVVVIDRIGSTGLAQHAICPRDRQIQIFVQFFKKKFMLTKNIHY